MADPTGNSGLFAIFFLTIYSLVIIPYTVYSLCCSSSEQQAAQSFVKGKETKSVSKKLKKHFTKGNLIILLLWVLWFGLLYYVSVTAQEMKPFDPFEILEIQPGASDKDIKKAYRQLSLKFHPDKNPDPKAGDYFRDYITKAYQALTDEVSRNNFEKYGHPDGPQAREMKIALPEWMFSKDQATAPLLLLGLVGGGILLPLCLVSWYMLNSNKFVGPNQVMQETLAFYFSSKHCVKESQSVVRIPETLVCAMEFIMLPTPSEHEPAIAELRKSILRYYPDLKEKPLFWKRRASVLKAHLLLLAHLERDQEIPALLQADLKFVLQKTPLLLEEILKISLLPRPPMGYGWLTPAVAAIEMMQCVSQGVSIEDRKTSGKPNEIPSAAMTQLPHFNGDVVKKLKRKRVNAPADLLAMPLDDRMQTLQSAGLSEAEANEANVFLMALPSVHVKVNCEVDGEEEIMERDPAKCKVRLLLTRPSHKVDNFEFNSSSKTVRAFTPHYPHPRDESWFILLVDPSNNAVLCSTMAKVSLVDAEAAGLAHTQLADEWASSSAFVEAKTDNSVSKKDKETEEPGQVVEMMFPAPKAGRYDLQLVIMSDCYVGCDRVVPIKLRVQQLTRAVAEGRDAKALAKAKAVRDEDSEAEEEEKETNKGGEREDGTDAESDGEIEESDYDYDSDETGEEETDEEEDDDEDDADDKKDN